MTQLYVGNLSADGDEKAIRALFSRYGVVREVLMKNGYAFVEFEDACSADTAMRDLNGGYCITRATRSRWYYFQGVIAAEISAPSDATKAE